MWARDQDAESGQVEGHVVRWKVSPGQPTIMSGHFGINKAGSTARGDRFEEVWCRNYTKETKKKQQKTLPP